MSERKVWFITGASRGLGRAIAEAALAAGHSVAASARSIRALRSLQDAYADRVLPLPLDVSDPAQVDSAVASALDHFGHIDVVVNNAGYANIAPVEQIELDDIRAQVDAVFYGTVYVTRALLPHLRARRSGHIIQIVSTGGRITVPGLAAYHAAKFAVEGFSGALRQEVEPLGITVTLAEPGAMRTDYAGSSMTVRSFDQDYDATVGATAHHLRSNTGREPIDPDRVASVVLDVAEMDAPPFHLVLGSTPVRYIAEAMQATVDEDRRWAALGRSVDFPAQPMVEQSRGSAGDQRSVVKPAS